MVGVDGAADVGAHHRREGIPQAAQGGDRGLGEVDTQVDEREALLAMDKQGGAARGPYLAARGHPGLERADKAFGQRPLCILEGRDHGGGKAVGREQVADGNNVGARRLARLEPDAAAGIRRRTAPRVEHGKLPPAGVGRAGDEGGQRLAGIAARAQQIEPARAQPRVGAVLRQHGPDPGGAEHDPGTDGDACGNRGRADPPRRRATAEQPEAHNPLTSRRIQHPAP